MEQLQILNKWGQKQLAKYFKTGSHRVTLVIPHFPLVFKFPRPKIIFSTLRILLDISCQMVWRRWKRSRIGIIKLHWSLNLEEQVSALLETWSEFVFYLRTRHP